MDSMQLAADATRLVRYSAFHWQSDSMRSAEGLIRRRRREFVDAALMRARSRAVDGAVCLRAAVGK